MADLGKKLILTLATEDGVVLNELTVMSIDAIDQMFKDEEASQTSGSTWSSGLDVISIEELPEDMRRDAKRILEG